LEVTGQSTCSKSNGTWFESSYLGVWLLAG
jgi:hypothetical protein